MGTTPIGGKKTWNHHIYMVFRRIGGPLVEFIKFSPRVLWYEVPNHQYKYYGVVLDEFHVDS